MLSGKKIGPGPRVRQVTLNNCPDVQALDDCVQHISTNPIGAETNLSWPCGPDTCTLSVSYSRFIQVEGVSHWKMYREHNLYSQLLWEHQTNDTTLIYNLVVEELGLSTQKIDSDGILSTKHGGLETAESRYTKSIRVGLKDNLRHFISGVHNIVPQQNANFFLQPEIKTPSEAELLSHKTRKNSSALRLVESLDTKCSRPILNSFIEPESNIFSSAAFLFLLECEYYSSLQNHSPMALILFSLNRRLPQAHEELQFNPAKIHECLQQIAGSIRTIDSLCKYDKDTFAVILPETNLIGGKLFAQRIEQTLNDSRLNTNISSADLSVGVASVDGIRKTLGTLCSEAELALNKAATSENNILGYEDLSNSFIAKSSEDFTNPQPPTKVFDLTETRRLTANLLSQDYKFIFNYHAFMLILERELTKATRNNDNLFAMVFRIYRQNDQGQNETLPPAILGALIQNIAKNQRKGDVLAQFWDGNFIFMRPKSTDSDLQFFGKKIYDCVLETNRLDTNLDSKRLKIETRIFAVQKNSDNPHLINILAI